MGNNVGIDSIKFPLIVLFRDAWVQYYSGERWFYCFQVLSLRPDKVKPCWWECINAYDLSEFVKYQ